MVKPTTRAGYTLGLRRDDMPAEPPGRTMFEELKDQEWQEMCCR